MSLSSQADPFLESLAPQSQEEPLLPPSPTGLSQARFEEALGRSRPLWRLLDPGRPARELPQALSEALERAAIQTATGQLLRLAPEQRSAPHYELRVLHQGELAYRPGVWHDWFNALCWLTWPQAKAALNFRHCLHYTACLIRQYRENWRTHLGRKVARDRWMQMLANLDEGGCVIERGWQSTWLEADAARVLRWKTACPPADLELHLSWFGHAVLELLKNHCEPPSISSNGTREPLTSPPVVPRMFVLNVDTLRDEGLASRILTVVPELEPELELARAALASEGIHPTGGLTSSLVYGEEDPFAGNAVSLLSPWGLPPS